MNVRTTLPSIFVGFVVALLLPACRQNHNSAGPFSSVRVTPVMIEKALNSARSEHKSLMVEFGANWCSDCQELSRHLEDGAIQDYLRSQFIVLKVDVGKFDRNLDTAMALGIDINVIPTAVFLTPAPDQPVAKVGTHEILAFLSDRHPVRMLHRKNSDRLQSARKYTAPDRGAYERRTGP
jgi:thioredoxin 1